MDGKEKGQTIALARIQPVKKRVILSSEASEKEKKPVLPDSGSAALPRDSAINLILYLSQLTQNEISPERIFQVKKELAPDHVSPGELLDLVRGCLDLTAVITKVSLKKLSSINDLAILICYENRFLLLSQSYQNNGLLYDPQQKKNVALDREELKSLYTGQVIQIKASKKPKRVAEPEPPGKFNTMWLIKMIMRFRVVFFQVLIAAFLIQVFALVTPLFTMVIIDKVFSASGFATLHVLIIGLFAISIFDYLISSSRQMLLNSVTHKVDYILATAFFKKLTTLPLSFFSTKQIGDAVSRVKELEVIRSFFTGSAFMLLIDFPFLLVFIGVMLLFSVKLTIMASAFIGVVLLLYGVFGPFIRDRLKSKNRIQSDNNSFLIETIGAIEAIKSMSLETRVQNRWNKLLIDHARNSARTETLTSHVSQFAGFLTKSTTAVCLWLGALLVLEGEMTPGQLIAFNMMVGRVIAPTQRISQLLQQLNQLKISLQRVGEIMNASPELHVREASQLPRLNGSIRVENVSFRYREDGRTVLEDISFEIRAGENVALIGATGSGKSTLLRLLQRLYLPTKGNIYIDNINVMGINPVWFREKIGVVSQENVLFNQSIIQNICMAGTGFKPPSVDDVVEVCKMVGADSWIRRLPNAYDTIVGERGSFLSGGQRQQISIARALLRDPRILLLDEATSALDNESETIVEQNMARLFHGRTVVIVAHRLPHVNVVDRIITLGDGKLIKNVVTTTVSG
ncbi:MAG: peptidase domain-containing ABC transporter [bacterium]